MLVRTFSVFALSVTALLIDLPSQLKRMYTTLSLMPDRPNINMAIVPVVSREPAAMFWTKLNFGHATLTGPLSTG